MSGEKVIKALKKAGFEPVGIRERHHYFHNRENDVIVTVHSGKILAPKTLQSILSKTGLTTEEFCELL
ncbi:type II toxin-antitoxin system HicA family toxin [Methanoplanus endosymbiosus]|uniref:type II toxin-antitoxin system HicA family toxin n=1 Tax=Methanoplanus endosymbiosus TaxID=33865 RepID=UPI0027E2E25B|nr:type II toxin-antitoxin system HicA family toxin [Methanoplanus endosymbiosus]